MMLIFFSFISDCGEALFGRVIRLRCCRKNGLECIYTISGGEFRDTLGHKKTSLSVKTKFKSYRLKVQNLENKILHSIDQYFTRQITSVAAKNGRNRLNNCQKRR